ncbi:hypothetical protein [Streptomyces cyaneofuscatus]|uniref:hypothetical protein n=1 Tax=Streptomyces cyaneofuscatus TaxID=66883 RepID=UPI003446F627
MARRARPLDPSEPLEAFASDLRRLRDAAPPRRTRAGRAEPFGVDHVVAKYGVGRSSVYAALSGRRLPSRTVLRAMVLAWDPRGEEAMPQWMGKRLDVESALGSATGAVRRPAPDRAAPGTPVAAAPGVRRHGLTDEPPPWESPTRPQAPRPPEPLRSEQPPERAADPAATVPASALVAEIRRLYEAAGRPPLQSISSAVLADPRSTDISPETVRRVVSGTRAKQSSVIAVARALAALGDGEVADAEQRAFRLHEPEAAGDDEGARPQDDAGRTPRFDFRGAVIHGLHLTAGDGQTLDLRDAVLHTPVVQAGDGQTVNVGDSTLNGMAVWGGDRQTFHFGNTTVNEAAVRGGDRQTFHFGNTTVNGAAVAGGDEQTFRLEDGGPSAEPDGAATLAGNRLHLALPGPGTEAPDEDPAGHDPDAHAAP